MSAWLSALPEQQVKESEESVSPGRCLAALAALPPRRAPLVWIVLRLPAPPPAASRVRGRTRACGWRLPESGHPPVRASCPRQPHP